MVETLTIEDKILDDKELLEEFGNRSNIRYVCGIAGCRFREIYKHNCVFMYPTHTSVHVERNDDICQHDVDEIVPTLYDRFKPYVKTKW